MRMNYLVYCIVIILNAMLVMVLSSPFTMKRRSILPYVQDVSVVSCKTNQIESLKDIVSKTNGDDATSSKTLLIYATYAADFNAAEYVQKLRYYLPRLQEKNVKDIIVIFNASKEPILKLKALVDLPDVVDLYSDPTGEAGKMFGVSQGWLPDNDDTSPYLKLFGMLFGLGAVYTLPSVIAGYIGNPFGNNEWIEDALITGENQKRWPVVPREAERKKIPIIGGWKRRPFELATLRLQNMLGISLGNWNELKPTDDELKAGVLTQLGGAVLLRGQSIEYEFRDRGICHTMNFESLIKSLK